MIYLTSDWHFNHNKDFIYKERGFSSVEEMNIKIIENHNSIVSEDDDVYCLGDCCLGGPECNDLNKNLIESLNGKIHIITGNHCTNNRIKMYNECKNIVEVIQCATMLKYNKYHLYLSHFPTLCSNLDGDKPLKARIINCCGHTHTKDPFLDFDKGLIYHVEMEAHNCYPVPLDNIIEEIIVTLKHYYGECNCTECKCQK